jgi:uncharacterized protein (UPF0262 family)
MTLSPCFTAVTLDPAIRGRLTATLAADCDTICAEIARDAAVFLSDGTPPPYQLFITLSDNAMILRLATLHNAAPHVFNVHVSPIKRLMHDYDLIIGAHGSALRHAAPGARVEAIDMGRRAMHNEGAELVLEQFAPDLTADLGTARLLFTLLFLLTQRR